MRPPLARALVVLLSAVLAAAYAAPMGRADELAPQDPRRQAVEATLDDFHRAAAAADGARYFGLMTPDGVFLGTDASERWSVEEFRAYAEPYFDQGQGWTYTPLERHVAAAGSVAWFDERLWNEKYGESRGSGVLLEGPDGWRIAHYNLTFPIPNDLAAEFTARIKSLPAGAERRAR